MTKLPMFQHLAIPLIDVIDYIIDLICYAAYVIDYIIVGLIAVQCQVLFNSGLLPGHILGIKMVDKKGNIPRIQDVAKMANVSTATVSRALSFPDRVSEATREVVLQAIEKTGYTINQSARNLRKGGTGAILVLLPNLANSFFSRVLKGIEAVASQHGFSILIADSQLPPIDEITFGNLFNTNRIDGAIILDGNIPPSYFARARRQKPQLVFACEWIPGSLVSAFHIDNLAGAMMATDHLVALGHRRIGHVTGPANNVLSKDRLTGFERSITKNGLPCPPEWKITGDFTIESGVQAARHWLALPADNRPTALFCASDEMAFGLISALHQNGINVPDHLSIIGFDDVDFAAHSIPALTTIHQPRRRIGEAAARALIHKIRDADAPPLPEPAFDLELVLRASTAPYKAG